MIREKQQRNSPIVIDLTGPEGNAFTLLSYAQKFGKQLGWNPQKLGEINAEMMADDYENLLKVFDREFGKFVILER